MLGIQSRKKRAKQTSLRVNVASDDNDPAVLKNIPFTPEIPPFLISTVGDNDPGILRAGAKDEPWLGRVFLATPRDFKESVFAPVNSVIGMGTREPIVIKWCIFGQLSGPLLLAVVSKPLARSSSPHALAKSPGTGDVVAPKFRSS